MVVLVEAAAGVVLLEISHSDTSCLDKLHEDASLFQLRTWRIRWSNICQLNHLITYPVNEQVVAFGMVPDPPVQQIVEVLLGMLLKIALSPADVLDLVSGYIRSKCIHRTRQSRVRRVPT